MMPKLTSAGSGPGARASVRVVIVTLDHHLSSAVERVEQTLQREIPGLKLSLHAAATFGDDPDALDRCKEDIGQADLIVASMLFMEDHIRAVMPALEARRADCDGLVAIVSASEVVKLTRIGSFAMDGKQSGPMALLKRLRGKPSSSEDTPKSSGAGQMAMLKRLPKILRFIPGTAQDVRAYFLTMQYWLAASDENLANLVRLLVSRYGKVQAASGRAISAQAPVEYPDVGLYHPDLTGRVASDVAQLPPRVYEPQRPTVGLLVMRSYVLAGNTAHYDAVIRGLEARGFNVLAAFASGLDARPAIDAFFMHGGRARIDALLSLSGFSLVGGPAYNDSKAAQAALAALDVPYIAAHALEFQTLDQWEKSERGLLPVEATMMVAIPELDGSTGPMVFGGRAQAGHDMVPEHERIQRLVERVERIVLLRQTARVDRKLAVVLFNFPPNAGAVGTAAYLSVFESLFNVLQSLKREGYSVDVPADVDALRRAVLEGSAQRYGMNANVHAAIPVDAHVKRERWLKEIEAQWGSAPGRHQTDGRSIFVLGRQFGNVLVTIQPAFGYEGDPMRLLFERSFAPTHAFSAFYRYLNEDFGAHAVLHFGTHGALEFMPGKQAGLGAQCWPDRLIGAMPNFYLYAANNPSEGAIAKRRAAATLVSYLTPPVAQAGLYRGLLDLKDSINRFRQAEDGAEQERLVPLIRAQAETVNLASAQDVWPDDVADTIKALNHKLLEVEYALIPDGLHVVGAVPTRNQRIDLLTAITDAEGSASFPRAAIELIVDGASPDDVLKGVYGGALSANQRAQIREKLVDLARTARLLGEDHETGGLVRALDGRFVAPSPSGDLIRTPDILPTGRNIHGFDPYRMPSAFAMKDGAAQAQKLIDQHLAIGNSLPSRIAMVLWGSDNLKSEGGPIAQALALMGARPRFDSYGRLCGAELIPLAELGRPRIDVILTLSGIFRDLLPLQTRMLAEAAYLAATADEPEAQNHVRRHALAYATAHGVDIETAALRVFSNAEGAYGSNVNHLIENGAWQDAAELGHACTKRKGFAYGRKGAPAQQAQLLQSLLAQTDLAYQNLESVELGVTTVDHYFDTLGGMSRAIETARGTSVPVYIGDQTRGVGTVRTLDEQVALETRTRMLNPRWYEGLLKHGYEGVRQIEAHVTNTMGWSATTQQVAPWVYEQLTTTFVLDPEMRARLAALNPTASARLANRLMEASDRKYWTPTPDVLEALRTAGEELEDRVEGI
ncbi:MAG: magnesium chelatase, subunit, partial [Pseudomonadota bacterium]